MRVILTGTSQPVRRALLTHGARPPLVKYRATVASAVAELKQPLAVPDLEPATLH